MATLQFTFSDSTTTLCRPLSQLPSSKSTIIHSPRPRSFVVKASLEPSRTRRQFIAETTAISVLLPSQLAKSEETLSEWERVYLPIDPGVVLLDIAFVPQDPNHGDNHFILLLFFVLFNFIIVIWS